VRGPCGGHPRPPAGPGQPLCSRSNSTVASNGYVPADRWASVIPPKSVRDPQQTTSCPGAQKRSSGPTPETPVG
jgi:hypothetical protein